MPGFVVDLDLMTGLTSDSLLTDGAPQHPLQQARPSLSHAHSPPKGKPPEPKEGIPQDHYAFLDPEHPNSGIPTPRTDATVYSTPQIYMLKP